MNTTKLSVVLGILISFTTQTLKAQEYEYGKVTKALLEMEECSFYPDADAMITYTYGENLVRYLLSDGFYTELNVKKQYKIFKNDAKDIANIYIDYYSPKNIRGKVKLKNIKGKTYNLENGKILETKVSDQNIFEAQINDFYKRTTITMPNIQKLCVFEVEYYLESEHYTEINDWDIQDKYPVLYNEFYTSMPVHYKYQISVTGPFSPKYDKTDIFKEKLETLNRSAFGTENTGTRTTTTRSTVDVDFTRRKLVFEKIPPMVDEPFMSNPSDYQAKISHQLIIIDWPGYPVQNIASDYQTMTKKLLELPDFGKVIKDGKFISDKVDISDAPDQLVLAARVYNFFQKNVVWDGYKHYRTSLNGKDLLKKGKGDIADINLNYIAALNHLGIASYPILLRTRGAGSLHPSYPNYSTFNYVVAISAIGDKIYLSDASSELPFGNLPTRCLNGNGWIVSDKIADWISLKNDFTGRYAIVSDIKLEKEKIQYQTNTSRSNYFAYHDYNTISDLGEQDYLKKLYLESELKIDSLQIVEKNVTQIKSKILSSKELDDENIIYVNLFAFNPYKNNPFTATNRNSIVDFPFKQEFKFLSNISLAEGDTYEVPTNLNAVLGENDITIRYTTTYNEHAKKLSVVVDLKINKTDFIPFEYTELKESFESIVKKLNEPVVIKRLR